MKLGRSHWARALVILCTVTPVIVAQSRSSSAKRLVLVELYTSQGCDMCPTAEKFLGELGDSSRIVAPVALHVDYFDKPWKDPFSDKLHSERQMSYHNTYKGQKDPDLGLYYTPMVMVDGLTTVNGRDPAGLKAAVTAARQKPPGFSIRAKVDRPDGARTVRLTTTVGPLSGKLQGRDQLICAVLRDDKVATEVKSGENADKTLSNRYPVRKMQFETLKFEAKSSRDVNFEFAVDPAWDTSNLNFIVFVQEVATGEVHQSAVFPLLAKP